LQFSKKKVAHVIYGRKAKKILREPGYKIHP